MLSRRDFLKSSAMATTGLLVPMGLSARTLPPGVALAFPAPSPVLTKFVNQLFVPPGTTPDAAGNVILSMENNVWNFHDNTAELGPTKTFGYMVNGIRAPYLGATIVAQRGQPITMTATNNLGAHPMAPWINASNGIPGIQSSDAVAPRACVHHHAGYNQEGSDGGPFDWFPGNTSNPLLAGRTFTYTYANDMPAATQWYHDHAHGVTRLNVYAGLAGGYLLRDQYDTGLAGNPLGLPYNVTNGSTYELPLVLQDKSFIANADGTSSLNYTANAPTWLPEFFGDVAVVNGKIWPNLNVEPAIYRFRVINGSEARLFNLSLSNGGLIYQIGTDSGLLNAPVRLSTLLMAPGERADILVDFRAAAGTKIILQNNAPAPFPSGGGGVALPQMMQFTVGTTASGAATLVMPTMLRSNTDPTKPAMLVQLKKYTPVKQMNVMLYEVMGANGLPALDTLNIMHTDESLQSVNAVTMQRNTLVQWNIANMTGDVHPLHLHLVNFQLLNRQNFNTVTYQAALDALPVRNISATNQLVPVPNLLTSVLPDPTPHLTGPLYPPAPNEAGWKDTIMCPPGQVTRILVPVGYVPALDTRVPSGNISGVPFGQNIYNKSGVYGTMYPGGAFTGSFVYHCHILDHEENDMMQMFQATV